MKSEKTKSTTKNSDLRRFAVIQFITTTRFTIDDFYQELNPKWDIKYMVFWSKWDNFKWHCVLGISSRSAKKYKFAETIKENANFKGNFFDFHCDFVQSDSRICEQFLKNKGSGDYDTINITKPQVYALAARHLNVDLEQENDDTEKVADSITLKAVDEFYRKQPSESVSEIQDQSFTEKQKEELEQLLETHLESFETRMKTLSEALIPALVESIQSEAEKRLNVSWDPQDIEIVVKKAVHEECSRLTRRVRQALKH